MVRIAGLLGLRLSGDVFLSDAGAKFGMFRLASLPSMEVSECDLLTAASLGGREGGPKSSLFLRDRDAEREVEDEGSELRDRRSGLIGEPSRDEVTEFEADRDGRPPR
jgi:hypothetical protein